MTRTPDLAAMLATLELVHGWPGLDADDLRDLALRVADHA